MRFADLSPAELARRVDEAYWAEQGGDHPGHDPDLTQRLQRALEARPDLASRVLTAWLGAPPLDFLASPERLRAAATWYRAVLLSGRLGQ